MRTTKMYKFYNLTSEEHQFERNWARLFEKPRMNFAILQKHVFHNLFEL